MDLFYIKYYILLCQCILKFIFNFFFRYLIGFKNLLRSIESFGIASVYGINYFGRGSLGTDSYVSYIRYDVLGKDLLNATLTYVPSLKILYKNLTLTMMDYGSIRNWYINFFFILSFESIKIKEN